MITERCFTITRAGVHLIAKLLAGETLHLTRVTVGAGDLPEDVGPADLRDLTDLVEPKAQAVSSEPTVSGGVARMTVEYRNDLNGGLNQGFWISEFGIFADDPDDGEVMIYYATLGLEKQYVSAMGNGIDVRRFPIAIAIGEDRNLVVDFSTDLWMTEEDVHTCYYAHLLPVAEERMEQHISVHNLSVDAHPYILGLINSLYGRISLLELIGNSNLGYRFLVTFGAAEIGEATYSGIWNKEAARIEF